MDLLFLGNLHKVDDGRTYLRVQSLSKLFNRIFYQFNFTGTEDLPQLPENVVPIPVPLRSKKDVFDRIRFELEILSVAKTVQANVFYIHNFPRFFPLSVFKAARLNGASIFYEINEVYPVQILRDFPPIIKSVKEGYLWRVLKKQMTSSAAWIFVSEESGRYILSKLGLQGSYHIIPCYARSRLPVLPKHKREKVITFVGGVRRNLDQEIPLLRSLLSSGFRFKIVGSKQTSQQMQLISHEFIDFLPYNKMLEEISTSAFTLISFTSRVGDENYPNDVYALPYKFHDSLAAGVPVIVNERFVSQRKIVEELGIGVVINPKRVEESSEKILQAWENYDQILENLSRHQHLFVWTEDKEKAFLDFVKEILHVKR